MNFFPLFLQLFCGLIGGNIVGATCEKLNFGLLVNSLVGLVGGAAGGQFYEHLRGMDGMASSDASIFIASAAGGSVGGALAVTVVGWVRSLLRPR